MADSQTTLMGRHIHQTWLDGYQRAIEAMRSWAEEFGDEQSKAAILNCATMVELAKPSFECLTAVKALTPWVGWKLLGR